MRATIITITPVMVLGEMADGAKVFFALSPTARRAKMGDIFSFTPEEPKMLRRKDIKYFGRNPLLVEHAPEVFTEKPGLSGLPSHHDKNYDKEGNLKIGPRPSDLAAQWAALSRVNTAQTS